MTHAKVLIIGAGPAGYTAAIYAARAGLAPLLVAGPQPGGQLMITTDVENYPGFADAVTGPDLMAAMRAQAERVGTALAEDTITGVALGARPFTAHGAGGAAYTGDALIIATGAKARWLGLESEAAFQGRGVSACATCDGFFFRGQDVAVIGGGNSAVEEALYLAGICRSVTLVHRRDTLRAEKILQARLFARENVSVRWNAQVAEITGDASGVTGVRLAPAHSPPSQGGVEGGVKADTEGPPPSLPLSEGGEVLAVTGVFIAIGHDPATAPFRGAVDMDGQGYIRVAPGTTRTSVPGVFAAGDVADKVYRQAVTAAGLGCMAALEAEKFLAH